VAKFNPGKFIREVRAETEKVSWPSSRETVMTTVMVVIMASLLGGFFFGVDSIFGWVMQQLLKLV
jgi:preprotein translocase subunit SecE